MACFIMKARTLNGDWVEFGLEDMPLLFSEDLLALTSRNNSPHLVYNTIRRGDPETGLFEGDVIEMHNDRWLVCYERGFYIINSDYIIKHFCNMSNWYRIGTCDDIDIGVPITFKNKHIFKYADNLFTIKDIVGSYNGKVILRFAKAPVDINDINQECCCTYNKSKLYFNDIVDNCKVELHGGRITIKTDDGFKDLVTGGIINGSYT